MTGAVINLRGALSGRTALVGYVAVLLFALQLPVIVVVLASLSDTSYLTVPPKGLTMKWFAKVLEDPSYLDAILTSLQLAVATTAGSLLLGTAAAYALSRRHVPQAEAFSAVLMAPLVFPAVVVGVALLQYYSLIGIRSSFAGVIAAHIVITVPYVARCALASLGGTHSELEDAARALGANGWTAFFLVTLPLIRPGLMAGGLFSFIVSFDNVPVSIFLLGVRDVTLPVKIFTAVEHGVDPTVAAVSTLLIIATAICLTVAERLIGFHRFV